MKLSGTLRDLSGRLGHEFRDPSLLIRALTHGSRGGGEGDNQRLEFLGDRVLGLVMAEALLAADPRRTRGASRRASTRWCGARPARRWRARWTWGRG